MVVNGTFYMQLWQMLPIQDAHTHSYTINTHKHTHTRTYSHKHVHRWAPDHDWASGRGTKTQVTGVNCLPESCAEAAIEAPLRLSCAMTHSYRTFNKESSCVFCISPLNSSLTQSCCCTQTCNTQSCGTQSCWTQSCGTDTSFTHYPGWSLSIVVY